jgi:hypothetical protein
MNLYSHREPIDHSCLPFGSNNKQLTAMALVGILSENK